MEFWKKYNTKTLFLAHNFQLGLSANEIRLGVKDSSATAICLPCFAFEIFALCF